LVCHPLDEESLKSNTMAAKLARKARPVRKARLARNDRPRIVRDGFACVVVGAFAEATQIRR
jgi:hypothetical protein